MWVALVRVVCKHWGCMRGLYVTISMSPPLPFIGNPWLRNSRNKSCSCPWMSPKIFTGGRTSTTMRSCFSSAPAARQMETNRDTKASAVAVADICAMMGPISPRPFGSAHLSVRVWVGRELSSSARAYERAIIPSHCSRISELISRSGGRVCKGRHER